MRGYIYALKDGDGDVFYVGATVSPHTRISAHLSILKTADSYTPPVYHYMRENNIVPTMEILESKNYRSREGMFKAEAKWIGKLQKIFYLANICYSVGRPKAEDPFVEIEIEVLLTANLIASRLGITIEKYVTSAVMEANKKHSQTISN